MARMCPFGPEFDALKKELGSAASAHFVYNKWVDAGNTGIPNPEQGRKIMDDRIYIEKDEKENRSSTMYKLQKAKEQKALFAVTHNASKNKAQKETFKKLWDATNKYILRLTRDAQLEADGTDYQKTISVSNFVGGTDFYGDPTLYEAYRQFGNFMHEIVELGTLEANEQGKLLLDIFDKEYFKDKWDKFNEKNPIVIDKLDSEVLYEQAQRLVAFVSSFGMRGSVVLPEITVMGSAATGADVIGRIDLMVVDPSGTIHVVDFKTKKLSSKEGSMFDPKTGELNMVEALAKLGNNRNPLSKKKEGTAKPYFKDSRSTFDNWMVQLDVYDNMLSQHGLEVGDKTIASFMYEINEDNEFVGAVAHMFHDQAYYEKSLYYVTDENASEYTHLWYLNKTTMTNHIENLKEATMKAMPRSLDVKEEKKEEAKEEKYEVNPTEKNLRLLVGRMLNVVDSNTSTLYDALNNLDKNKPEDAALIEIIKKRLESLNAFKEIAKSNATNPRAIIRSSNFFTAVETVNEDLKEILSVSEKSMELFKKIGYDTKKGLKQVTEMYAAFSRAKELKAVIDSMQEIVNEAMANPANGLTADSEINKTMGSIHASVQAVQSIYKSMAVKVWLQIAKTPGEEVFKRVEDQIKQAYEPLLAELMDKKAKLEQNLAVGPLAALKRGVFSLMNKEYRENIKNATAEGKTAFVQEIEDISKKIEKVEAILNGFDGSEETLTQYLEGASDPSSYLYVGTDIFVADVIAHGRPGFADFIASAGNSDIAVATPVLMMKNTQSQATYNAMNDPRLVNFDRKRDQLLKKYSLEEMNEAISEWREVVYYDSKSGKMETKRKFFLVKPFSQEYETKYKTLEIERKTTRKDYEKERGVYNVAFEKFKAGEITKKELDEADKRLSELRVAKENASKDYIDFIRKYANTPYVEDFYKLQSNLPEDIRDKIGELYHEQEQILYTVGKENVIDLQDEADFDRVKEIDIEIKRLRDEAKERDPNYAEQIDRFNELYEYDTNEKYYERKRKAAEIKYGLNSEKYQEWINENTVEKPKSEWYNDLNELYEQKQALIEMLPGHEFQEELDQLYDAKRKLLSPYKRFGRINTKYMTDEDIHSVDAVQDRIDEIMMLLMSRPKQKIDKAIGKQLSEITNKINALVSNDQLSPIYEKDFESRYAGLENAWRLVNEHQNARDVAEKNYELNDTSENLTALNDANQALEEYTDQFYIKEEQFEQWYNRYHNNNYKSIADGFDSRSTRKPKTFNFERLPDPSVADKYMERVPDPKYYKVKKLRRENWYLDGAHLHSSEIEALRKDPTFDESEAIAQGRLIQKEGAFNKDFHEGPEGILLPKGVKYEGKNKYSIQPGFEGDPNISDKFKSLKRNQDFSELYDLLSDLFFGLQSGVDGKKIGYQIPGFASNLVEKYAQTGSLSETLKSEYQIFKDKNFKVKSEQDHVENIFGDLQAKTRMRFTVQLPEDMQSQDAISSIMKYSVEAHYNIAMQEIAPMAEAYIDYLELQKEEIESQFPDKTKIVNEETGKEEIVNMKQRVASLQNTIDILKFERNKYLYGQVEDDTHRSVKKAMNALFAYTSFIRIGFDVANQVKNNIAGNVQSFIAAGNVKSNHYTQKDWVFGKKMLYGSNGFLANFFKDYGRMSDLSVSTMLYRFYNPAQKDPLKYFQDVGGGAKRKLATKGTSIMEMGYLLQDKGESEIAITVMYAILNNHQVKLLNSDGSYKMNEDGTHQTIPAHEAYLAHPDTGALMKRTDVEFSDATEARLRNTIYSEMRRAQGNYASADMTKFEEGYLGKIVYFYRKFLVPTFLNRFGWTRPNWEAGEVAVGYWRAMYQMFKYFGPKHSMKELLVGSKMLNRFGGHGLDNIIRKPGEGPTVVDIKDDEMRNELFIRNAGHARRDMFAMAFLTILSLMALGYVRRKDDEDEPLGVLEGNAFRILWGVKGETLSMFPVGGGSDEYIRNFTTAVPMVREVTKLKNMAEHGYKYGLAMMLGGGIEPDPDYDSEFYKEIWKDAFYTKKQGPYEAGTAKIKKDFIDLLGIRNFRDLLNPEIRIDQLKKKQ